MTKKYIKLIFSILILGMISTAYAMTILNPSEDLTVTDNVGESRTFKIITDGRADVEWFINDEKITSGVTGTDNVRTSTYRNRSAAAGTWEVKAVATNTRDPSDTAVRKWTWIVNAGESPPPSQQTSNTSPTISGISVVNITDTGADISFTVDQSDAKTIVRYGTTTAITSRSDWNNDTGTSRTIKLSNLLSRTRYYYSIYAYNSTDNSRSSHSATQSFTTLGQTVIGPKIISKYPENAIVETGKDEPVNFTVTFDQIVDITWRMNGTSVKQENDVISSYYINNASSAGTRNITVTGRNGSASVSHSWTLIIREKGYNTGNRVWDGSKGMSTTYIWTPQSFSGFYYNVDDNLGTEELKITGIKRTISRGDLTYKTTPIEVNFEYSNFGKYNVIGFMADKYFAGYTQNSTISNGRDMSAMGSGQLHKVLFDDDEKRTVTVGGTLSLKEGYVLKLKEIDVGSGPGQIWISLLKDGGEIDNSIIAGGGTYIYSKRIGSIDNFPVIAIHFDSVFRGRETEAAFVKGIFQLSESTISVKSGDRHGLMEISGVSRDRITMDNRESIGLSSGSTIDLMGNLKIIVADSDTLRFALSVEMSGEFEVRGTVYPVADQWTPMNFGLNMKGTNIGFYYDLDEDIGTEKLKIDSIGGSSIPEGKLVYSTSPQEVSFSYSNFGKYQVIGFMADKYFAGYTSNTNPPNPSTSIGVKSTIVQGQLHRVLIDDDDRRTISVGSTLTLKDGYVLKATDIDMGARTMLLVLLKDGNEVDSTPLSAGQTYVYTKKVGGIDNLPIIIMRFDSVFSGVETQAAFVKGLFQISESITSVKNGDTYGKMEVSNVGSDGIRMRNYDSIGLSSGSTIGLMGNIKFKVADSSDVRFYPFVLTTPDMVANQLIINASNKATAGDIITVNVTAGKIPVEGVSISMEPDIGPVGNNTDKDGIINISIPIKAKGRYDLIATKIGYQKANNTIEIERYIAGRLSINVPSVIDQFDTIPIQITSNSTNISNVTVTYDNNTIGTTDSDGVLSYTFNLSGDHIISVSKDDYLPVSREVNVREPYVEFRARDISIIPNSTFIGKTITIKSNITNVGTNAGNESIELTVDDIVVDDMSLDLGSKEIKEISFAYKVTMPEGNYTVEILDQEMLLEVKKSDINLILIVVITTIVGAIAIYAITSKDKIKELIRKYKNR